MNSQIRVKQVLVFYFFQEEFAKLHLWIPHIQDDRKLQTTFFFSGFCALLEHRPPFHWMYLIRRLWILIEYPSENDFHKKWRGTWQRTVTVTQWSSHIKMFLPFHLVHPTGVSLILRLVMSGSQNSNIIFFHNYIEEKKKWQGGKKAKKTKQPKLSSHFLSPFIKKEKHFLESSKPEMARTESCS